MGVYGALEHTDAWGVEGGNAWQHHDTLLGSRRGGGGSGFPIARPIGIMMIVLAVLAVAAHKTKQVGKRVFARV